jgi:DNA replication and repair protein RecF
LVIISPADQDLIVKAVKLEGSLDSVISQLDSQYLQHLIQYQKVLNQRNALLKYFALNRVLKTTPSPFIMNNLMGMVNISSIKKEFISQFIPSNYHHHAITGSQETVQVVYESHLFENNLLVLLQENINKDRVLHYTSVGTKTTSFEIDGHPIKNLVLRDNSSDCFGSI